MESKKRNKIQATTQDHLEVLEIVDDLAITKTGSVVLVLQTSAVNFDLLSEYEQDSKIMAFAGLLNSLNFHIQILIRTKRIDISNYVKYLKSQHNSAMSPGLKKQLEVYTTFIENLIVQNDVLDKKFYIAIPYSSVDLSTPLSMITGGKEEPLELNTYQMQKKIEQGKIFLYPKRDHILKQLGRMGLTGHQLTTDELVELFYDIYNEGA
jgi:hypothetical protein